MSKLTKVGDIPLIAELAKGADDAATTGPKEPTRAQRKLMDAAAAIRLDPPDAEDLAYMARELIICTLPHRDPGQVPFWKRTNGNFTLSIVPDYNPETQKLYGYPYGAIPRLLLFWMTSEAVRNESRRLELGSSYGAFLKEIGLSNSGRGKLGDANRVRNQLGRLLTSRISFIQSTESTDGVIGVTRLQMNVAFKSMLWWNPKRPDQMNLFENWIELGEGFYEAITAHPVPLDTRALRYLKQSPLALDLYSWSTHKALQVAKKGKPQFIPWKALALQFGSNYSDHRDFKKAAQEALENILRVYPGLKLEDAAGGIKILPTSKPAVPSTPSRRIVL